VPQKYRPKDCKRYTQCSIRFHAVASIFNIRKCIKTGLIVLHVFGKHIGLLREELQSIIPKSDEPESANDLLFGG
jgi:hypothetical protein